MENTISSTTASKKTKKNSKQRNSRRGKSKKKKKSDPEGAIGNEIFDQTKEKNNKRVSHRHPLEEVIISDKNEFDDDGFDDKFKATPRGGGGGGSSSNNNNNNNNLQQLEYFQEQDKPRVEMRQTTTSLTSSTSTTSTSPQNNQQQPQKRFHHHLHQQQQGGDDDDEEDMPFFVKQRPARQRRRSSTQQQLSMYIVDTEERQLFNDTFSFLMTARYPCEREGKKMIHTIEKEAQLAIHTIEKGGRQLKVATKRMLHIPHHSSLELGSMRSRDDHLDNIMDIDNISISDQFDPLERRQQQQQQQQQMLMQQQQQQQQQQLRDQSHELSTNARKLLSVNADYLYLPFFIGWIILFLQIFIYFVVFINILQIEDDPPNADPLLRSAQFFALMVSLYTQGDLVDAIFMLTEGSSRFESITTPFKFNVANAMRFGSGNIGLMASFMLVIYAPDIIELILNFTAIEFVSLLDNHAFKLSSKGFFGINIEKKAKEIEQFRYEQQVRKSSAIKRLLVYIGYFLVYGGIFLVIVLLQKERIVGVENEVYAQFHDSQVPELFGISGSYVGCVGYGVFRNRERYTGNIGYVEASYHNDCPSLKKAQDGSRKKIFPANSFYYCSEINGWVYIKKETSYPCDRSNRILRSFNEEGLPSDSFDILSHSDANWFVQQQDTNGEVLVESVFIKPAQPTELFGITYNCTGGLQPVYDTEKYGTLRERYTPLPQSYYPIFDVDFDLTEESNYFKKFSLVYRQVFLGDPNQHNYGDSIGGTVTKVVPDCDNIQDSIPVWYLLMFDGLRWHYFNYFDPILFVEYAKNKYEDAADKSDSECKWKIFLKYYLRDKSWMFDETIARPTFISEEMHFSTPVDTGGPTPYLEWFEVDVIYSDEVIRPGTSTLVSGSNLEVNCRIKGPDCAENEIFFNVDLMTGRFPEETAILIQRNPSVLNVSMSEYLDEMVGEKINFYNDSKIVPVTEKVVAFTISENEVQDFRFRDGETIYDLEACVPVEVGLSFCIDVTILNTDPVGVDLVPFDLGFGSSAARGRLRDESASSTCTLYHVCYVARNGMYAGQISDPEDCSLKDIKQVYPGISNQVPF